jgi:S-formylglutathione hydrolase FrmB
MPWLNVRFDSAELAMPAQMYVLLPQSGPGPYKTLYLLHGKRQDHTAWMRKTTLEDQVGGLPLAVVMPNAGLSWYADMKYGRRYFTYIARELPKLCETMFDLSPRRGDRFIAGLSMGGYGAVKAALAAPETFGGAMSLSGMLDLEEVYDRADTALIERSVGTREEMRGSVCDLFAAAERFPKDLHTRFYLCCGTEDDHIRSARRFRDHAAALGLRVEYEESPGKHDWAYWGSCIPAMLRHAMGEETRWL